MAKTTKGFVRKAMASLVLIFCVLVAVVLVSFFSYFRIQVKTLRLIVT